MFILPLGTARVAQTGVPLFAVALALALVGAHVATSGPITRGVDGENQAVAALVRTYAEAPYVTVPPDVLAAAEPPFTAAVEKAQAALAELQAEGGLDKGPAGGPDKGRETDAEFVDAELRRTAETVPTLPAPLQEQLHAAELGLEGGRLSSRGPANGKAHLEMLLQASTPESRAAAQATLDERAQAWRDARQNSLRRQWGFMPEQPTLAGAFGHMVLTPDWIGLIFAVALVLATGAGLLELWPAWTVTALFVVGGLVGAAALLLGAPHQDVVYMGPEAAVAALLGAYLLRCYGEPMRFGYLSVASLSPRLRTFEAPSVVLVGVWLLGLVVQLLRADTFDLAGLWASLAALAAGAAMAFAVRVMGLETSIDPLHPHAAKVGSGGLLAAELQRKRERWGQLPASPAGSALAGLRRVQERPDWSSKPVTFETGVNDSAALPQPTAEFRSLDGRGETLPPAPRPVAAPDAPPQTHIGRPSGPRAAGHTPPRVVVAVHAAPPITQDTAAPHEPGPTRPHAHPAHLAAPLPPPDLTRGSGSAAAPPALQGAARPAPQAAPPLPQLPRPTYAIAFKSPDAQPIPAAESAAPEALAMTLPVALRTDDNRQMLAAFVRSGRESVAALDPTEAIRLARGLAAEGYPEEALHATRLAAARDPRGPYAARALLLEARLLLDGQAHEEARERLEELLRRFPGDPVRDVAKELLASL